MKTVLTAPPESFLNRCFDKLFSFHILAKGVLPPWEKAIEQLYQKRRFSDESTMAAQQKSQNQAPDELVISSDIANLPTVEAFIVTLCEKGGLTEDQSDNMAIAVTELVNNAILHGNQQDPNKNVTVRAVYNDDSVVVSVKDEGEGFDPEDIANPTDPQNLWKQNGRGVFLVQHLISKVDINSSDSGTEFILTEYIK